MKLFNDTERHYEGPSLYGETQFDYLDRSARPVFSKTRQILESWFSRYPSENRPELRTRFRLKEHAPAFFELFLHELVLRLGCKVRVHPLAADSGTKLPDFLVHSPLGRCFYMEAAAVSGMSREARAAEARASDFYKALSRLESPNFWVRMEVAGAPDTPVPTRPVRSVLEKWLASMDPEQIAERERLSGFDALPSWPFEHQGWHIRFRAIPKPAKLRGREDISPIEGQSHEPRWMDPGLAVKDAVRKKATRYGKLPLPYIVAVNALDSSFFGGHRDAMRALFGRLGLATRTHADGTVESWEVRTPDGAWYGPSGPMNTRVSAALIATGLLPWSWPRAEIRLYHNPWAERPYVGELTRLSQGVPAGDVMELREGESVAQILGVPAGWPR